MANPEHLSILRTGSDKWNAWRSRNPTIRPDLSDAAIVGDIGIDDPYDVYLQGADLRRANLERSVWVDAMLSEAKFGGACLSGATMKGCNLTRAGFAQCEMLGTLIIRCDLEKADFADVVLGDAVLVGLDLSAVRGLASVVHRFGSSIGIDTLQKSRAGLERDAKNLRSYTAFLLAAGVPQKYLDAAGLDHQ